MDILFHECQDAILQTNVNLTNQRDYVVMHCRSLPIASEPPLCDFGNVRDTKQRDPKNKGHPKQKRVGFLFASVMLQ